MLGCRLRFLKFRCLGVQDLRLPASFSVKSAKYVCFGLCGALQGFELGPGGCCYKIPENVLGVYRV